MPKPLLILVSWMISIQIVCCYRVSVDQSNLFKNLLLNFNNIFHKPQPQPMNRSYTRVKQLRQTSPSKKPSLLSKLAKIRLSNTRSRVKTNKNRELEKGMYSRKSNMIKNYNGQDFRSRKAHHNSGWGGNNKIIHESVGDNKAEFAFDHGPQGNHYYHHEYDNHHQHADEHEYGEAKDLNEDVGSFLAHENIGTGKGNVHSRTKIFVNKNANIIQHSKHKTSDKAYNVHRDTGVDLVNEQETDFQEALNSFNFLKGILKNSDVTGKMVTQKIEHVDDHDANKSYKEMIIDNDLDELSTNSKVSQKEANFQKLLRKNFENHFDAHHYENADSPLEKPSDEEISNNSYVPVSMTQKASLADDKEPKIVINQKVPNRVQDTHPFHQQIHTSQPINYEYAPMLAAHNPIIHQIPFVAPSNTPIISSPQSTIYPQHLPNPFVSPIHIPSSYYHNYGEAVPIEHEYPTIVNSQQQASLSEENMRLNEQLKNQDKDLQKINNNLAKYDQYTPISLNTLEGGLNELENGTKTLAEIIKEGGQLNNEVGTHGQSFGNLEGEINQLNYGHDDPQNYRHIQNEQYAVNQQPYEEYNQNVIELPHGFPIVEATQPIITNQGFDPDFQTQIQPQYSAGPGLIETQPDNIIGPEIQAPEQVPFNNVDNQFIYNDTAPLHQQRHIDFNNQHHIDLSENYPADLYYSDNTASPDIDVRNKSLFAEPEVAEIEELAAPDENTANINLPIENDMEEPNAPAQEYADDTQQLAKQEEQIPIEDEMQEIPVNNAEPNDIEVDANPLPVEDTNNEYSLENNAEALYDAANRQENVENEAGFQDNEDVPVNSEGNAMKPSLEENQEITNEEQQGLQPELSEQEENLNEDLQSPQKATDEGTDSEDTQASRRLKQNDNKPEIATHINSYISSLDINSGNRILIGSNLGYNNEKINTEDQKASSDIKL